MYEIPTSLAYKILKFDFGFSVQMSEDSILTSSGIGQTKIPYVAIKSKPEVLNGFLWDRIVLKVDGGERLVLSGIKKNSTNSAVSNLLDNVSHIYNELITSAYQQIDSAYNAFKELFSYKYIRYRAVESWREKQKDLVDKFDNEFVLDLLTETKSKNIRQFLGLFHDCHSLREKQNQIFVEKEKEKFRHFFDTVENNPLTEKQRLACIVNEDNNLILAGAGSGKTSVIIAKAGYILAGRLAKPNEILILAYGRKASKETDERIKDKLPNVMGIKTSTFHKLGLDIIGIATGKRPRVSKFQEDSTEFYLLINNFLTELTKKDSAYNQRVIDYFVTHLIPYKSEFDYEVQGEYFSALKDGDVRSLKSRIEWAKKRSGKVSLKQEKLKSFEEVVIADFLFVNRVEYEYEHPYEIHTATPDKSQYQPDFYLPEYGIYIEHFGVDRDGNTPDFVDQKSYVEGMKWKRVLHKQHETTLIETYSYEMREGTLTDRLYSKLEKRGVKFSPLSYQELIELLSRIGEDKKASQFNKLVVNFLDLFKQSGFTIAIVRELADNHHDKPRCHAFLDIFEPVFLRYTHELEKHGTVDFSDMIRKATELVDEGQYRSPFKYILVDEFQDISAIRAGLVQSLIRSGNNISLSCVGDDWQSIYRFSGSDINYTGKFEKYFGYTIKIALDKTFRFNDRINSFATTFITENPEQIRKDIFSHKSVDSNAITLVQYYQDIDRAIQECVEDVRSNDSGGGTIYILGRYSFSKPSSLSTILKYYPEYSFSFDTVHASKGKEADYVIIVDVNDDRYGFPSNIQNDPLLELVLPPAEHYEHAEERRLFYVAVTRSRKHSYILYDVEKPSVFVKEIKANKDSKYCFNEISTEGVKSAPPEYGSCPSCGTGKLRRRESRFGNFFFGCSHYPLCNCTPITCAGCNKYPLVRSGNVYKCLNPDCDYSTRACQLCSDGVMVRKNGRYGEFWGCSNYSKTDCRYTVNISN
jgi:DNA helicase-4